MSELRARYTSASDGRLSSQIVGFTFMGLVLMVMLLILAKDAPTMIMALKHKVGEGKNPMAKKRKSEKHQLAELKGEESRDLGKTTKERKKGPKTV